MPKCSKKSVVPDKPVTSLIFPAAASVVKSVSETLQMPCTWTKLQLFPVPSCAPSLPSPARVSTFLVDGLYHFPWRPPTSVKTDVPLNLATFLISPSSCQSWYFQAHLLPHWIPCQNSTGHRYNGDVLSIRATTSMRQIMQTLSTLPVSIVKAGFHMIADDRGSQIADDRKESCFHIIADDRKRSQSRLFGQRKCQN